MKGQVDWIRLNSDPQLPQRVVQSLRRDASERGKGYLDSAADLIELLLEERQTLVIVTVRHPDFGNEAEVFGGKVEWIDIDEGSAFDVTKIGPHYEYPDEVLEWAAGHTAELLALDNDDARQYIGTTIGQVLQILYTGSC